jgi:2-haloacid dehalogenase
MQPAAFVFDAYGTLFDVHSAAARHAGALGERWVVLSELWRTKQLEYTWVRALAGKHCSFWKLTEDGLDYAISTVGGIDSELRGELLASYRQLAAYPEVPECLKALKARGSAVAILSNGDPDMLADAVNSAGLADAFDAVLSVEDVGVYKPSHRVYELATERFGVSAREVSFQSSNRWDIAGAKSFGFRTVWINRAGRPDEYLDLAADEVLKDLTGLLR